jgi:hypothetical protein
MPKMQSNLSTYTSLRLHEPRRNLTCDGGVMADPQVRETRGLPTAKAAVTVESAFR